jgi:hypothetical protein
VSVLSIEVNSYHSSDRQRCENVPIKQVVGHNALLTKSPSHTWTKSPTSVFSLVDKIAYLHKSPMDKTPYGQNPLSKNPLLYACSTSPYYNNADILIWNMYKYYLLAYTVH